MDLKLSVTFLRNPFDALEGRDFYELLPGKTIREYAVQVCGKAIEDYDIVPSVNGCQFVEGQDYENFVPSPGDHLVFCVVPQGSGGGKSILALVAIIAIMVIAPSAGVLMGDYLGGAEAALSLATGEMVTTYASTALYTAGYAIGYGAVMLAGGMLLSALAPKAPSTGDGQTSQTYAWTPTGNYAQEGAALPELFGVHRVTPPLIAKYISADGTKQYINMLFAVAGHAIDSITSIRINGTPVDNFTGIQIDATKVGSTTQAVIPYFNTNRAETPVGVKLNSDTKYWYVRSITAANPSVVFAEGATSIVSGTPIFINGAQTNANTSWIATSIHASSPGVFCLNGDGTAFGSYVGGGFTTAWTKRTMVNGTTAQGLGFLMSAPNGLFLAADDGTLGDKTVDFKIQYRPYSSDRTSAQANDSWINTDVLTGDSAPTQDSTGNWQVGNFTGTVGDYSAWVRARMPSLFGRGGFYAALDPTPGAHTNGDQYIAYVSWEDESGGGSSYEPTAYVWWWIPAYTNYVVYASTGKDYVSMTGKTASPIHRYVYSSVMSPMQYEMRTCMYNVSTPNTRMQDTLHWEAWQEVVYNNAMYPGVALLGIRALASDQLSGSMPMVDCIATRSKVWIRDASNVRSQKDADNPAWASLYILQKDGEGVPYDRCDYTAFSAWADRCYTTDGIAVMDALKFPYTVNIYLDTSESLRKQLNKISLLGRGVIVQIGTKFTVIVDKPETSTQKFSFGMGNMMKDTYREEWLPMDERSNAVEVTFFNMDLDYQRETIEVQSTNFDTVDTEINKASATLYGCTNIDEAAQYGKFLLNCNKLLTLTASWEAGVDAIACLPGDVVTVSHDIPQYGYSGRVVSATSGACVVDQDLTYVAGCQITVRHQATDVIETQNIASISARTVTLSGTWTAIPDAFANYVFSTSTTNSKQFRVIHITKAQDMTRKIIGIEYNENIYSEKLSAVLPPYTDLSDLDSVTNLVAAEIYTGGSDTKVALRWGGAAILWSVYRKIGTGSVTWIGETSQPYYEDTSVMYGTQITYYVTSDSNITSGKSVSITPSGKTTLPQNISSVVATSDRFTVSISWASVGDFDLKGYEIRSDTNWGVEDSGLIYKGMATSCTWIVRSSNSYTVYAKAFDAFLNYSATAASYTLVVSGPSSVSGFTSSLTSEPGNLVLSWNKLNPSEFDVGQYEVRYGAVFASATSVAFTKSNMFSSKIDSWSGTRRYWVCAIDVAGNYGSESLTDVTVVVPGAVTSLTATIIDSNVLLKWVNPTGGSLPIREVQVRKGTTWAGYTVDYGRKTGTFTVIFETEAGNNTYWVCPIDSAGNSGTPASVYAVVNQPPDYIMYSKFDSTWASSLTNGYVAGGVLYMPVSAMTWGDRFNPSSWTTLTAFNAAGMDYVIQPAPPTGVYMEGFDFGSPDASKNGTITVGIGESILDGTPTYILNIKTTPASGTAWTDWGATNPVYVSGFRHAQVTLTSSSVAGDDTDRFTSMFARLDAKLRTDTYVNTSVAADAGGTAFSFLISPAFQKVQSITLTPESTSARYAAYQYTPGDNHFHVLVYDNAGTRQTCGVSWVVRGI